jgi:hypothetical protein
MNTSTAPEEIIYIRRKDLEATFADDGSRILYKGHVSLGIHDDEDSLPELLVCIRETSLEFFSAVEEDVQFYKQKKKTPVMLGQVGVRCIHCKRK